MAGAGAAAVVVFAALHGGGLVGLHWSDLLLFAAVAAGAVGYAEGGLLSRELGACRPCPGHWSWRHHSWWC